MEMQLITLLLILAVLGQDHRAAAVKGEIFSLDMALDSVDDQYDGCTGKMMNMVNLKYLAKERSGSAEFYKTWKEGENNAKKAEDNLQQIHSVAIHVYTNKAVYSNFNSATRTDKQKYREGTFTRYSLHFLLTEAIQILKKTQAKCYSTFRGTNVKYDVQSKEVRLGSFSSSSLDRAVAEGFGSKSCFEIHTCEGADVTKYSKYPKEKEVLIPPYETFNVTAVKNRIDQPDLWCDTVFVLNSTGTRSYLQCAAAEIKTLDMALDSVDDQYKGCAEKMADHVNNWYLEDERTASAELNNAWQEAERNATSTQNDMTSSIHSNHLFAIYTYTFNDTAVYDHFNDAVYNSKQAYIGQTFKWYSLHFLLTEAIQILKKTQIQCYCTYRRTKDIYNNNTVLNKEVRFGKFASSSMTKTAAVSFGDKTCFEIYTCEGANITNFSKYREQQEVLIPPYETFEVTAVKNRTDQPDLWCETVFVLNSTGTKSDLNCAAADVNALDRALDSVDDQYNGCTVKMMNLVNLKYLAKERFGSAEFYKSWQEGEENAKKAEDNLQQIHSIAIHVYTNKDSAVYSNFNSATRTDKQKYREGTFTWYSLHFLLTDAIQILKKTQNRCYVTYRGTNDTFYVRSKEVRLSSFSSSSLDRAVAEGFGSKSCFEIYTCEGADLTKYSKYPEEKEVLIPPYEKFNVIAVKNRIDQPDLWCDTVYVLNSNGTRSDLKCAAAEVKTLDMALDSVDDQYKGCAEQMAEDVKNWYLVQERTASAEFNNVWQEAERNATSTQNNMTSSIHSNHLFAIYTYTFNNTTVYDYFNDAVYNGKQAYIDQTFMWYSLHFLLTEAIQIQKKSRIQCYWTYRRTKDIYNNNTVLNKEVRFGKFASSSMTKTAAVIFGDKTCFEIYTCEGVDIMNYSKYPKQQEVLIPPYETFKVIDVKRRENQSELWCDTVFVLKSTGKKSYMNCALFNTGNHVSVFNLLLILTLLCLFTNE